jgi:hypothetical protein
MMGKIIQMFQSNPKCVSVSNETTGQLLVEENPATSYMGWWTWKSEWSDSHFGDSPCYTMGGTSHANTIGQSSGWFPGFVLGEWHVFLLLVPPLTATTVGMVFGHKSQHSCKETKTCRLCKVVLDNRCYRTTRIPCQRLWSGSIHLKSSRPSLEISQIFPLQWFRWKYVHVILSPRPARFGTAPDCHVPEGTWAKADVRRPNSWMKAQPIWLWCLKITLW